MELITGHLYVARTRRKTIGTASVLSVHLTIIIRVYHADESNCIAKNQRGLVLMYVYRVICLRLLFHTYAAFYNKKERKKKKRKKKEKKDFIYRGDYC